MPFGYGTPLVAHIKKELSELRIFRQICFSSTLTSQGVGNI